MVFVGVGEFVGFSVFVAVDGKVEEGVDVDVVVNVNVGVEVWLGVGVSVGGVRYNSASSIHAKGTRSSGISSNESHASLTGSISDKAIPDFAL